MSDLIIKPRSESEELLTFRSLNTRSKLSDEDMVYYLNLEKGYKGELMFDEKSLKRLTNDFLILNDITFKHNNSTFQIDSFLISQKKCYIFEVKNLEGDYLLTDGKFCSIYGKERKDPISQLNRCESLLRQLFEKKGINLPIEGFLVFVNPDFYLYNAPVEPHIIFPTQLDRFVNKFNSMNSKLNPSHHKLADKLMQLRLLKSQYSQVPEYQYDDLKKGNLCPKCFAFMTEGEGYKVACIRCGYKESFQSAVLRSIDEITLLFPNYKITSNLMMDWCGSNKDQTTFLRILSKNLKAIGHGRGRYYIKS